MVTSFISCQKSETNTPQEATESSSLNFSAIASKLVERADPQPGEKILLVGIPGQFDPLIELLSNKISETGAVYLGTLHADGKTPALWTTEFTEKCEGQDKASLAEIMKEVDLGIMLPGAIPSHLPYKVLQEQINEGLGRTIHFHWAGAYDLNGQLLEMDEEKDAFYEKVLLDTDYKALAEQQVEFEDAMRGNTIHVTTPAGTDVLFSIADRPVTKQDGNASAKRMEVARNLIDREVELPAGAIRVAPMEETVNGKIAFPDAQWNGEMVEGLIMSFENGKVVDYTATKGRESVKAEIEAAGEAGHSFREFAIGFNPLLTIQEKPNPWIPYYGYGSGIIRLSLGDNTELGGKVGGGYVRWNFFTDATVKVGETVWVKDGKGNDEL